MTTRTDSHLAKGGFFAAVDRSPLRPCSEHKARRDPGAGCAMQSREAGRALALLQPLTVVDCESCEIGETGEAPTAVF